MMKNMIKTFALAAIAALALTGCIKHEPYGHRPYPDDGGGNGGHGGGGTIEEKLNLRECSEWTFKYWGRVQDSNSKAAFERFTFSYTGSSCFLPLVISEADLKERYSDKDGKADIYEFFSYEVALLQQQVKAQPDLNLSDPKVLSDFGVYVKGTDAVDFKIHIHGTWILFMVELDSQLNLTGRYSESTFTIIEETPTAEYERWIGKYTITDRSYGSFDIEISQAEANYLYYVDGWETGHVDQPMDGERDWLYARFGDGRLYFYAQFLQKEEFDGITVDEVFGGTYLTPTSDIIGELDSAGVDFEDNVAFVTREGNNMTVQPWTIEMDNGYSFTYSSMRYSRRWFTDNGATFYWSFYNRAGVPMLPAEMTPIPGTRSSVSAPAVRQRTKGTVHRDQLKPVRTVRQRRAMDKG